METGIPHREREIDDGLSDVLDLFLWRDLCRSEWPNLSVYEATYVDLGLVREMRQSYGELEDAWGNVSKRDISQYDEGRRPSPSSLSTVSSAVPFVSSLGFVDSATCAASFFAIDFAVPASIGVSKICSTLGCDTRMRMNSDLGCRCRGGECS